jgi:hypothetical protein
MLYFNKTDSQNAFESLKQYQQTTKDWVLVIYHMILKMMLSHCNLAILTV